MISLIGLGFMFRTMPLRVGQMKRIFLAWLIPITVGMIVSALAVKLSSLSELVPYLGAYWLLVIAVGYFWNGLVDPPGGWYWFASVLNLAAAILCYVSPDFTQQQYLVAAIVSAWSMANLWLFRT